MKTATDRLLLVLMLVYCFGHTSSRGTVIQHPKSRLVPIYVEVTFICKISGGVNTHWNINGIPVTRDTQQKIKEQEGFIFYEQLAGSIDAITLRVNATADKNGTRIYCSSLSTHSVTATLLIIAEPPLLENPYFENPNASSIILKWSPPYLWPAQVIDYYNISVFENYNSALRDRVDTIFSEAVVSWQPPERIKETQTCTPLTFVITAVSSDSDLVPVSITGGYLTTGRVNSTLSVNITALFKTDRSPLAIVNIKFPPTICSYEHFSYSIMTGNDNITKVHGPYQHYGSVNATHMISSGLQENKVYTLTVVANTSAGYISSQEHQFNTSLHLPDLLCPTVQPCTVQTTIDNTECANLVEKQTLELFLYQVFLYTFMGVTVFLLLVLMCICCCATHHRRKRRVYHSANRVCNTMTHNPIYDGPVYDSIHPQFHALPSTKTVPSGSLELSLPARMPSAQAQHQNQLQSPSEEVENSPAATDPRYVKQQQCNQKFSSQFLQSKGRSQSPDLCKRSLFPDLAVSEHEGANDLNFTSNVSETFAVKETSFQFKGAPVASGASLYKDEQEKTQISFPAAGIHQDFSSDLAAEIDLLEKMEEALELCSSTSASLTQADLVGEDEKYTVMSPVRPVSGSLNVGGGSAGTGRGRLELVQNRGDTAKFEE